MGTYLPTTPAEQRAMLDTLGISDVRELFADVPESVLLHAPLNLPKGLSEQELRRTMAAMARKNTVFPTILRGAGAYAHEIPAIVKSVASKETFVTAYTPYQAELSQGILQAIFEYQTMICELTGMDVSNASVYDGASAAAEAVLMCRERKRTVALVSGASHPDVIATIRTYCAGTGMPMRIVPAKDGVTDIAKLSELLGEDTACVYVQQPNFHGLLEDADAIGQMAHGAGAQYILGVNPIAMGILKAPSACGADIAVGEGQPLGMPLAFGGPYLGFMACKRALMRKLPGRIVGETVDARGERAFVLTLQAREQHIRREKAGSNICSNQALCALTASVYLAAVGPEGLAEIARQCTAKAHYLAKKLCELPGFQLAHAGPFFHEFATTCPVDRQILLDALAARGILGGLPVENGLLWCVTEKASRAELDEAVTVVREVCAR